MRAEGQYMYDEKGNRYLDCINNVAHGTYAIVHNSENNARYRRCAIVNFALSGAAEPATSGVKCNAISDDEKVKQTPLH